MSDVSKDGDRVTVKPDQDIVASMAAGLKSEFKDILDGGATSLVVDLAGVEMIDSMGLGVLIAAHNSLKKIGSQLELINVREDIFKLLRNMRLDQHFTVS